MRPLPSASFTNIASFSFDGDTGSCLEISGGFQMTNPRVLFGSHSSMKDVNGLVSGSGTCRTVAETGSTSETSGAVTP